MKKIISIIMATVIAVSAVAQHSLELLWQTDTTFIHPESVRPDTKSKILYVSTIGDFDKEGTGGISKISTDGKIIKLNWVTGLNSTKGLGLYKNLLYAAEQTTVAVIDVNTGTIKERIAIDGSQMLNDITIDAKGVVYVSDTKTNKVHKIENGKPSVYLENMQSANGLLAVGNNLYILTGTSLQKADANKKLTTITDGIEGGADGIEMVNEHDFIVTGWEGTIYYVKDDGTKQTLSDTRDQKVNAADIGYDAATRTLYVPVMMKNKVMTYKLK
ncbi:MAG: ATP/GTP-binding protein [Chitinophagaceae bacterium]